MVTTDDLRRMLDDAWDSSIENATPLRDTLRNFERTAGTLVSGGSLASVSKNSTSQTYAFGTGQLTTAEVARGWRKLIDLYDRKATALAAAALSTTDASLRTEMMLSLEPIREFKKDFSFLQTYG